MIEVDPLRPTIIVSTRIAVSALSRVLERYQIFSCQELLNGSAPDWSLFRGANVLMWPDGGDASRLQMDRVGAELALANCSPRIIDTFGLEADWSPHTLVTIRKLGANEIVAYAKEKVMSWRPLDVAESLEIEPPTPTSVVVEPPKAKRTLRAKNGHQVVNDPKQNSIFIQWEQMGLVKNGSGQPIINIDNVVRILEKHPKRDERPIWLDTFLQRIMTIGDDGKPEHWTDAHDLRFTLWCQRRLGVAKMTAAAVRDAVITYAVRHSQDSLCEWVNKLEWDKQCRLDSFLEDGFGTAKTPYTVTVGRSWLISMIARALNPGCQVDTMVVLEGPQGIKKNSALRVLGADWYAEITEKIGTKDFMQCIQGKWLIEIGELHGLDGVSMALVNATITKRFDYFRQSYGHRAEDFPRRCVFCGTTNQPEWLTDETGSRRFLPVRVREVNLDYLRANREQLFAEALFAYRSNEPWWDFPADETRKNQDDRYANDPWAPEVLAHAERYKFRGVTVVEMMKDALDIPKDRWDRRASRRISGILRRGGWIDRTERVTGQPHPLKVFYFDTQSVDRVKALTRLAETDKQTPTT